MELVLVLAGPPLVASVAWLAAWMIRRERSSRLAHAALEAGLTGVERRSVLGLDTGVAGRSGRFTVRLEPGGRSDWDEGLRIVFAGLGHGPFGLSVGREGAVTAVEKALDGGEIVLGDRAFDRVALVQGEAALARAVLGREARHALRELLSGSLRLRTAGGEELLPVDAVVARDELTVEVRRSPSEAGGWLKEAVARLAAVAEALVTPEDVATAIGGRVSEEAEPAVRLGSLRLLASAYPGHPATAAALAAGCLDSDAEVRLEAALALGAKGRDALRSLALSDRSEDGHAARAVEALGPALAVDETVRLLERALASGRARVAAACARTLAGAGVEAADLAEPALVAALAHEATEVREAALAGLGRIGTPRAVLPLRKCAAVRPLDLPLRLAARDAIARIQTRVEGAAPGQLSFAEGEEGRLSLVEERDVSGRLSLEPAEEEGPPAPNRVASGLPAT